jgi:hypothetical protein
MKKVLIGIGSVAAGLLMSGCVATTEPGYSYGYTDYPTTYVTPAPVTGSIWIEGDLYNDHGHWRRHPGHWERRSHYESGSYNRWPGRNGYYRGY